MFEDLGHVRPYRLHIPPGRDAAAPMPLVLVLHGVATDGRHVQRSTAFDAVADEQGFATLYPTSESDWLSAGACSGDGAREHSAFLRALIEEVESAIRVDRKRIYVSGISTGGLLAHVLACQAADLFAAAAAVAAANPVPDQTCQPARPISVLHVHGTNDTFAGYDGGGYLAGFVDPDCGLPSAQASAADWARRDGCASEASRVSVKPDWPKTPISGAALAGSSEWVFFPPPTTPGASCAWHTDCAEGSEVGLCTHDGQHDWPSGTSSAIWSFFARHALP